jgi:purine-binding chemotaxis protein CheW
VSVVPGDQPAETFPAAGPATFVAGGPGQFLSFRLDGHSYALPLALVAEITPFKDLNRIPHMPRNVEGLLDHRGQVVPVMNLRSRMNLRPQDAGLSKNIVVLDLGGARPVGILVDAVESVITVAPEQVVAASPLLSGVEGAWVLGFIRLPAGIISLLDPASITATRGSQPERQAIAAESFHETLPTS